VLGADYPHPGGDLCSLRRTTREDSQALDNSADYPLLKNEDRIDFTG